MIDTTKMDRIVTIVVFGTVLLAVSFYVLMALTPPIPGEPTVLTAATPTATSLPWWHFWGH